MNLPPLGAVPGFEPKFLLGILVASLISVGADIRCLLALWTGSHIESDPLALVQRFEAITLDCREVGKQIISPVIRGNKAKAFAIVKPFYNTCCHVISLIRFHL
jgi:hypothetical protein